MWYHELLRPSLLSDPAPASCQLVCLPTLRTFPMRFLPRAHLSSFPLSASVLCRGQVPKTLSGKWGSEDALSNLLSTSARWTGTRFFFLHKLFPLWFSFLFSLPCLNSKESLLDGIQKKRGKRSLWQRSSPSETNGLSCSLGHCFKATSADVQLQNKRESLTRHQPQSQQN